MFITAVFEGFFRWYKFINGSALLFFNCKDVTTTSCQPDYTLVVILAVLLVIILISVLIIKRKK